MRPAAMAHSIPPNISTQTTSRLVDKSMPVEGSRRCERALIKGPKEFRDFREDLPKSKG
jgi:hypothetical protein